METSTKVICAIAAMIVFATLTLHANSRGPVETVRVQDEPTEEIVVQDAPLSSGGFSYSYDQGKRSTQMGARYQPIGDEDPVGAPREEPLREVEPVPVDSGDPTFVVIPPMAVETDATVYPSEDDPAMAAFDMSDQEVLDQSLSMMGPEQRASFRATWMSMTADERQRMLMQMRAGMMGM